MGKYLHIQFKWSSFQGTQIDSAKLNIHIAST